MYYPFVKKWIYFDRYLLEYPRKFDLDLNGRNIILSVSGAGTKKEFSSFVTNWIPNYNVLDKARNFEKLLRDDKREVSLIDSHTSNLNPHFLKQYDISEDDAINYIYGLLHSKEFIEKYSHNLTKDIPHIPLVKHKDQYITIGKKIVDLHLHYESVTPYDKVKIIYNGTPTYRVSKMQFGKKVNPKTGKQEKDRSVIIFNNSITISNIPEKAYRYIINGESAIKLIMDQYQIKTDTRSGSGIVDDPNDYSDDPKYIFNLLLRIITVSLKTIDLINQLPKFEVKDD